MNKASIPILELLDESELSLPAPTITHNLERKLSDAPSRATVFRALRPLEEHELIRATGGDSTHYEITDKGQAYLNGEHVIQD
ncbi:winged-helix domain-containing protein [Halomicrococcus sp. NG-SE-24]|uniref:winged-helix domain-containing protein n=1 Tax=Halomicrococcus sp. NG-SE-24 TaxID=3436928 RepID=UPI003D974784